MTLKLVRFASLFLTALAAGVALSHALEMPNKLVLNGDTWIRVQQGLYHGFETFRALVESGAVVSTVALLVLVRDRHPAAGLTALALVLIAVEIVIWLAVIDPVSDAGSTWTVATLPANWTDARAQWEYGHTARAALLIASLAALIAATLTDAPAESPEPDHHPQPTPPRFRPLL
jgi:hypothetical protein